MHASWFTRLLHAILRALRTVGEVARWSYYVAWMIGAIICAVLLATAAVR